VIDLIPRDHWEHTISDLFRGLFSALVRRKGIEKLYIDGLGNCLPLRSGRAGLVLAIRALSLPPGARIGVPLYCCSVVFKAIIEAGCVARFIDIDPETFCISTEDLSEKCSQIDAILAVHMFGNMCDMRSLQTAAPGKPIIEDCAQALGSKMESRLAGSFGNISFFSFRSGKYLSVGEGGALFSTDSRLYSRLSQLITETATPTGADEFVHVVKTYIKSILRSRPLYGIVGYSLWNILGKTMNLSEKSGVSISQIHKADAAIVRKRLPLLDSAIKKQRANAAFYSKTLKLEPKMLCKEKHGTFYNRYLYPITFPSLEHLEFIADYLFRRKIDTMKYLDDIVDIAAKNFGYTGDCPVAEQLSKRVLIIPSYYTLREQDLQHISMCLNAGWAEAKGSGPNRPYNER
jgi:perosamine synthetase